MTNFTVILYHNIVSYDWIFNNHIGANDTIFTNLNVTFNYTIRSNYWIFTYFYFFTNTSSAETYTVRYDDNRYGVGTVTTNFSGTGGHISGYDGSNTDVTKGYHYDITRSNSVNAVLYIVWTDDDQYGTGGNVLNADVTGITFGYYNGSDWDVITSSPSGSIGSGNVTSNGFNFAGQYDKKLNVGLNINAHFINYERLSLIPHMPLTPLKDTHGSLRI